MDTMLEHDVRLPCIHACLTILWMVPVSEAVYLALNILTTLVNVAVAVASVTDLLGPSIGWFTSFQKWFTWKPAQFMFLDPVFI